MIRRGYAWAISAGLNAAMSAISAKLISHQIVKYGMVITFNIAMWSSYVSSLKALPSLNATVVNFSTNFISSGLAGFMLFKEPFSFKWVVGAFLIVIGVIVISKSTSEEKMATD